MLSHLVSFFDDRSGKVRGRILSLYVLLLVANVTVWAIALTTFRTFPLLIGTSIIAYAFGLRHAVDADHIAAIDNVTRRLMQEEKRPVAVGFFFSLGHSTVVVLASVVIAIAASAVQHRIPELKGIGGIIGTAVSAAFLFAIAIVNAVVLHDVYLTFKEVKNGQSYSDQSLNGLLEHRGLLGRFFRPVYKIIQRSWQMYPLGFLFGLGFDTATEIGLLGITATEATRGLPIWSILIFPALFTAGMSLIDTTDGVLMLAAYGWAYVKPLRKLYYNLTITFVSILVALFVGGVETCGLIGNKLELTGWFWDFVLGLNGDFGTMGYFIIGIFVLSWMASTVMYKIHKYDEIEPGRPEGASQSKTT